MSVCRFTVFLALLRNHCYSFHRTSFLEHQAKNPKELERPAGYNQCDFRDELVRQICEFDEYGDPPPPLCTSGRPRTPRPLPPSLFSTQHIPRVADVKKNCFVCWKREKVEKKITTYCSAPQCAGKFMHITRERNCFEIFHSPEYHSQ